LARAGIGQLKIVDRDIVEWTNLQRQVLFTEEDARRGLPKAPAAAEHIAGINSDVKAEPVILDVDSGNIESLIRDVDVILDGTDNVETRYLMMLRLSTKSPGCMGHVSVWKGGSWRFYRASLHVFDASFRRRQREMNWRPATLPAF
jgi:tRNA A37 threonylcarbamoyladenosine dehydratase